MWIYILKLENDNYYVGVTSNHINRLKAHKRGRGALWTQVNKPIETMYLKEIPENKAKALERAITLSIMALVGWEKVRGGGWSQVKMGCPILFKETSPLREISHPEGEMAYFV